MVLGPWISGREQQEVGRGSSHLHSAPSNRTSYSHELTAADVNGDRAGAVGHQRVQASANGLPRQYSPGATQIHHREDGNGRVAQRDTDALSQTPLAPADAAPQAEAGHDA